MTLTKNKHVLTWVDEMIALVKPDEVVWIDGSEEQLEELRKQEKKKMQAQLITGWIRRKLIQN